MMELGLPFETYVEQYRYKYLALYHAIRAAIHSGKLPEGTRLPATRELAKLYGVSRGSAAQSYDMLMAEGYVVSRQGSGTYVAEGIAMVDQPPLAEGAPVLSTWGQRLVSQSGDYTSAQMLLREPPQVQSHSRMHGCPWRIFRIRSGGARYPMQVEAGSRAAERSAAGGRPRTAPGDSRTPAFYAGNPGRPRADRDLQRIHAGASPHVSAAG